jgi:peroxiredoxin
MNTTETAVARAPALAQEAAKKRAGSLFWFGAVLAISVVVVFFLQVSWAKALVTPWYLPVGGTLAAIIMLMGLGRPRTWWRVGAVMVFGAIACLEWYFVLALTVLPPYTGPIGQGSAVPAFHAVLADGSAIDESYFQRGKPTVLVFFQGRWCPFCMTQLADLEASHDEFQRAGAEVVVVSIEDGDATRQTQADFPHLVVASDERREFSTAIDVINRGFAPEGGDSAAPTMLLIDGRGIVNWLFRPTRFIARPSARELARKVEDLAAG